MSYVVGLPLLVVVVILAAPSLLYNLVDVHFCKLFLKNMQLIFLCLVRD